MSAVIDGNVVSHEINQKQYDKFLVVNDYQRMKLFDKIFPEVEMKTKEGLVHPDRSSASPTVEGARARSGVKVHKNTNRHHVNNNRVMCV